VARRYVAGTERAEALAVVRELNGEGIVGTIDLLGEHAATEAEADEASREYEAILEELEHGGLRSGISVKLTHLGLKLDRARCERRLRRLVEIAASRGGFVRIDMEDSSCTDDTLDLYRRLRTETDAVGVVLQAYLRRSLADARALVEGPTPSVRICKGIYREPREIAFHDAEAIRTNFLRILDALVAGGATVGIATHDERLAYECKRILEAREVPPERFEFQMLLGVDEELRRILLAEGHRMRVYIPYGKEWHAYSLRRLRENPRIARYVLRAWMRG